MLTACVSRMDLKGTWQMRILGEIPWPGAHLGQERLGGPSASMGWQRTPKPAALTGHSAEPTLGHRTRIGTCNFSPKIHVPINDPKGV
jgi:hypothetical protein